MPTTLPPRSEIAPEYTWNDTSLFASPQAWSAELASLNETIGGLSRFQGAITSSPQALADWLDTQAGVMERVGALITYAIMAQAVDTNDQTAVAMFGQAMTLYGNVAAATAFAEPEILTVGRDPLRTWESQEPRLGIYAHYFDDLYRKQAHVRSPEVEALLGMATDPLSQIEQAAEMLTNADLVFTRATNPAGDSFPVAQGTISQLLNHADRHVRQTAWESYANAYLSVKNTLATTLVGAIKRDVFNARARRYNSALEASLFPNNIPVEVFHNLIDTFKKNIPTWHRYWRVRRKALGVETLFPYDIWAPLSTASIDVSYEQAVEWICAGMQPLGDEYVSTLRKGCLEDRWVDVYPNEGKRQGAFSSGSRGTMPFIMMSYGDSLQAMSTLAHELGHSMHSYFTWQNQPLVYSDYSLFVAEVASNFNQAMVRHFLMANNPDPEFQIAVIEEAMNNFHRYFFIMPTLARFELEMHERVERGESPTADEMIATMADLFAEGYGDEMAYNHDQSGITWAQFGHLYANFYVFQYATGISAAHALAGPIAAGDAAAAERYRQFLKAGASLDPIDALKLAGVDMATPDAVEKTFAVLADYVDRLEKLVDARA
jgi:oligoendopeptidase F